MEDRANSDAKPEEPDKLYDCQSYDQRSTDVSEDDATLPFDISAVSQQTFSSSSNNSIGAMEIPLAHSEIQRANVLHVQMTQIRGATCNCRRRIY